MAPHSQPSYGTLSRGIRAPIRSAAQVRRYLPLLETVYLFFPVPAWSRNLSAKVVRHPKIHVLDAGLAAHLLGVDPAGLSLPGSPAAGRLLETFVAGELARQRTWSAVPFDLHHLRDRDGMEVDLVLARPDGRVAGVEVKAARSLGEARIVSLRPVDAKGRAVKKTRMRLVFPGGSEIHGIDAAEAGGAHRFPPLPLARFDGHVHVEALAPGFFVGPYELPADAGPKGAGLTLTPTRTVTGRVLGPDRSPAAGARVRLANDGWDDDGVPAGPDGRFSLPGVPVGAGRELIARAEGLAPRSVGSPGGGDDVGDIVLPEGLFLIGRVREADGVKVVHAFIAASRGGQRVASCFTEPGGAFTLGPVEEGQYGVEVFLHRSEGVAGWRCLVRTVRPGTAAVDFVVPTGLRILLRDSQGKAVTSRDVETEIAHAGRAEPWKEHFNASGEFSELRMLADPETAYTITVRVAGFAPATGTATTDAEGRADVEMRLERGGR